MHARSHEQQCDAPSAHGELQGVALAGEAREERDGLLFVARSSRWS